MEEFGQCRRGVRGHKVYEELMCVTPGGYVTNDLVRQLDKWCTTNPSGSWGSCIGPIRQIRDLLLKKQG